MNDTERENLIKTSWQLHSLVEQNYMNDPSKRGDHDWLEKQRLLLADMAIHLLQTAVKPGDLEIEKLKNNIHSILTIADQFLPAANLKQATQSLYN